MRQNMRLGFVSVWLCVVCVVHSIPQQHEIYFFFSLIHSFTGQTFVIKARKNEAKKRRKKKKKNALPELYTLKLVSSNLT